MCRSSYFIVFRQLLRSIRQFEGCLKFRLLSDLTRLASLVMLRLAPGPSKDRNVKIPVSYAKLDSRAWTRLVAVDHD